MDILPADNVISSAVPSSAVLKDINRERGEKINIKMVAYFCHSDRGAEVIIIVVIRKKD